MIITLDTEDEDFNMYTHVLGYYLILNDIDNKLRDRTKYANLPEGAYKELEELRTYIYEQKYHYHLPND